MRSLHGRSTPRDPNSLRRGCVKFTVVDATTVSVDISVRDAKPGPNDPDSIPMSSGRPKVLFRADEVLSRFSTGQLLAEIERRSHRPDTAVFLDYLQSRGDAWGKLLAEFIALRSAKRRPPNT